MPEDFRDNDRPLTEDEKHARASDWSDYRKAYGVPADDAVRQEAFRWFKAGWDTRHLNGYTPQAEATEDVDEGQVDSNAGREMSPSERYWRDRIATEIRNNCTLDHPVPLGVDNVVRAVGDWVEAPPAWVGRNTPDPGPDVTGDEPRTPNPEFSTAAGTLDRVIEEVLDDQLDDYPLDVIGWLRHRILVYLDGQGALVVPSDGGPTPEADPVVVARYFDKDGFEVSWTGAPQDTASVAQEPAEWRILRAFRNGYNEGLVRGAEAAAGRPLDHS